MQLHVNDPLVRFSAWQVAILIYIAQWMVAFVWRHFRDPDSICIPYLTAIGDLLGICLLASVFLLLE